jgi:hypothetical protein
MYSSDVIKLAYGTSIASFSVNDTAESIQSALEHAGVGAEISVAKAGSLPGPFVFYVTMLETPQIRQTGLFPVDALAFVCDTSGTHNGLTVTVKVGAPTATFTVWIDSGGSAYKFVNAAQQVIRGPFAMLAGGNYELDDDGTIILLFSPASGRVAGESWSVQTSAKSAFVFPQTECEVVTNDLSIEMSGTYTGTTSESYELIITDPAVDGSTTFSWSSSTSQINSLTASLAPQLLQDGISVAFSSIFGHFPSARWNVDASAPQIVVRTSDLLLSVRGLPTSTVNIYQLRIANSSLMPMSIQTSVRS